MQARYSAMNQALHWLTALCMAAILPLAWVMTNADEKTFHNLGALYNWHKTLGTLVLFITAFRIVWRFIDKPPKYPPAVAGWDRGLAHAVYWLFFATLLWMPVTGFVMAESEGHPTKIFDLIPTPQLWPTNQKLADQFGDYHSWGQWAVYALILLHVAAVAFHLIWGKDGVLGRMLPAYSAEPPTAAPGYTQPAE